jgi:hypothetical protein
MNLGIDPRRHRLIEPILNYLPLLARHRQPLPDGAETITGSEHHFSRLTDTPKRINLKKPQQNRMSSPQPHKKTSNPHKYNHFRQKNSWSLVMVDPVQLKE